MCAGAACHSSVPLFPHSYSLEFLSSVCFVSDLNEQEEKERSLDKSDQGVDMLRLPPAGMPCPTLMRGREREVATENSGPKEAARTEQCQHKLPAFKRGSSHFPRPRQLAPAPQSRSQRLTAHYTRNKQQTIVLFGEKDPDRHTQVNSQRDGITLYSKDCCGESGPSLQRTGLWGLTSASVVSRASHRSQIPTEPSPSAMQLSPVY